MDKSDSNTRVNDLHLIPALQNIEVRAGITIRPLENIHGRQILDILNRDPSIRTRVTVASRLFNANDIAKEIESFQSDPGLIRYTILKDSRPIGLVSLWRDDGFFGTPPNLDDYGFGYFLDPDERGAGIVTETVSRLMETLLQNLHVRQFVAFCEANNTESITVLSRLSFKKNGEVFKEPTHGWLEYKYIRSPYE